MRNLEDALSFYRTRHRTVGCVLTHLVGIPMLALTPLAFLAGRKREGQFLLAGGLFLQWLGHAAFEKNVPTLIETKDPMIIPASLIFIGEKWQNVLTGEPLLSSPEDREPTHRIIDVHPDDIQL